MGRVKGNLIELFIDKIIMAAAIIAAVVILFLYVVRSPNSVEYDGERFAPGQIDKYINNKAVTLQDKLKGEPQDNNSYEPKTPYYLGLMKSSIRNVNINLNFPLPGYATSVEYSDRTYQLPEIGKVEKPSVTVVTMAAFVPVEELTDTVTYNNVETKLADMDIVTVESGIDAKQLYEGFNRAFAGRNIPDEWKIEQYAIPVFAKVELQRRTQQQDGSWSQWAEVPRTKICHLKKKLQLPTGTNEYEIQIALVQFAKPEIRNEILQPPVYDNAIPVEKWLNPSLYNERQKRLDKEQEELKKQQLEAERASRLLTRTRPATGRQGTRQPPAVPTRLPQKPKPVADSNNKQTQTEEQKFSKLLLTEKTSPDDLDKLVFWAHDDTTVPGERYQYRIRIGVLNPIAGKPWLSKEQKDLQNQVTLFSAFSEPTETITTPNNLYFFATDSREIEKDNVIDKTADVTVARYTMGNWISKMFKVKPGEQIGAVIEAAGTKLEKAGVQTDSIDLATGNVMIDTRQVSEWLGTNNLKEKTFYELLYYKPGQAIMTTPIKDRFWPENVAKLYKEIKQAEDAAPVVLLSRSQAASGVRKLEETRPEIITPPTEEQSGRNEGK